MAARRKKAEATTALTPTEGSVVSIKGFGLDWKCRDFQYALGQTYSYTGVVLACSSGFHAIEGYPLEVFDYYAPGNSRYAEVRQAGELSRHNGDSKLASAKITIGVELRVHDLVERAVKWVVAQCKPANIQHAKGNQSAASSTGNQSAASSTGNQSAASSTGDRSAASSTGDRSAASSTGSQSAAMSSGAEGRVSGVKGCALFLVYRDQYTLDIKHAWAGIVGQNGIKALCWYMLSSDGQPVEVE